MVQEECSELLLALAMHQRGHAAHRDIVEEAADVIIVAIQAAMIHGTEQELADFLEAKSARLMARINRETTQCDAK